MNSAISYSYHAPISGESDTITETLKNKDGKERRERGFHQDSDRRYARTVVANISKGFPCDVIIDHTLCKMGTWDCEFAGTDEGWCDGCNRQNDFENYTPTIDGCASFRQWSPRELERIF